MLLERVLMALSYLLTVPLTDCGRQNFCVTLPEPNLSTLSNISMRSIYYSHGSAFAIGFIFAKAVENYNMLIFMCNIGHASKDNLIF